jgi:hypothetical protein
MNFNCLAAISISSFLMMGHIMADQDAVTGAVTEVTLYRNQARVTRKLDITGPGGAREVVVSQLPENIVANSLFAESDNDTEIRAVQFRTRAIGESPREEVRELQDKLRANQQAIELNQKLTALLAKRASYLDKLENFVAPTATTELSRGVLDAEALQQVTEFNFSKREEIAEEEIELSTRLHDLQQEQDLLKRQLAEISDNESKTVREAILFLQKNQDGNAEVRLSYLVSSCGWSPSYTIRAESDQKMARFEYNGLIQQMSGEDWNGVKLTLSTATPALSSAGPGLAPFAINLVPSAQQQGAAQIDLPTPLAYQSIADLKTKYSEQQQAVYAIRNSVKIKDNIGNSWGLNRTVNELACAQIVSQPDAAVEMEAQRTMDESQPCLNYLLDYRVTLTSRNSQQMVRVLQTELPGNFYYVATPVLTNYVFREAELNNNGTADFLAGPITVYLQGRFVGRGEIPTVARGQTFVVGLGADSQLRTRRELVDKKAGVNGGNQEINVDYRLVVENYKDQPVQVRITDRLPKPVQNSDIRVTMLKPAQSLSDDKVYQRMERPLGILRWDAEVPARSVGDQVYEIDYSFSLEFDRKYQIALATDESQQLLQFEEIQARRIKR